MSKNAKILDNKVESYYLVNYAKANYSVKYSTADSKYLHFLQYFFFRLKPKQYIKFQYSRLPKKTSVNS